MSTELVVTEPALKHKERLLRKVKMNNDGSAEVMWKDYFVKPPSDQPSTEPSVQVIDHPGKNKVHDDFREAFKKLDEHWLIRGEEVNEPKANYPFDGSLKNLDRITVTSVTFSGGEPPETEGDSRQPIAVHIQGTMKLKGGGVKNYCLPAIKLGAPQEKYKFSTQLDEHIQVVSMEALAYAAGKMAPPPVDNQLKANFDSEPEEVDAEEVLGEEK